jgi:DNA mismatch repair protein MutL
VLAPLVANQIAAGEVVERPASVVKELVENAIDAGATRIQIDLEQGGIELVRVTDDGRGIHADDLPLAIAPHATSKVSQAQDLEHIGTLGFRGEALASIASVSRLSIRTRTIASDGALQLDAEADIVQAIKPAAGAVGTSVSVRNLFWNTPARRKFLRTVGTEQERCVEVVKHIALAHPGIGFRASIDGRASLDLPSAQSPRERALAILGKELSTQLLDVTADEFDDGRGLALWGLAGLPSIARGSNKSQYVFVNGRIVRDRTIQHAISEAYRGLIDPSRYPTVVLMIEMSPAGVDVNVHPQKAEVRFRDSSLVHSGVLRALRRALQAADLTPTLSSLRPQPGGFGPSGSVGPVNLDSGLPGAGAPQESLPLAHTAPTVQSFVEYFRRPQPDVSQPGLAAGTPAPVSYDAMKQSLPPLTSPAPQPAPETSPLVPASRVLQIHKSYLVTQDDQGVVIIDQHALHERVMFEYLLTRVLGAAAPLESQRLLAPVCVPATAAQIERLSRLGEVLDRLGVEVAPLGPATVGIHSFPTFLFDRGVDAGEFMQELLDKSDDAAFFSDLVRGGEAAMRDVLDMMSCKAAVKAGDKLSDLELGELVKLRDEVERSSNCPHGRPTSIRLTIRELEKLFGRG